VSINSGKAEAITKECHLGKKMMKLKNHLLVTTEIINLGKNHQWMLN
jgi:hypothetical protein